MALQWKVYLGFPSTRSTMRGNCWRAHYLGHDASIHFADKVGNPVAFVDNGPRRIMLFCVFCVAMGLRSRYRHFYCRAF